MDSTELFMLGVACGIVVGLLLALLIAAVTESRLRKLGTKDEGED